VRLWDVASGAELGCLYGHEARIFAVAYSPDGPRIASASYDGTVRVWDAAGGAPRAHLRDPHGRVRTLAFSPDGKLLASGGETEATSTIPLRETDPDEGIRLWDVFPGTVRRSAPWPGARVRSLAFSPDGQLLAAGAENGAVRVVSVADGTERTTFEAHTGAVLGIAFAPDGRRLATGSWDETVRVWEVAERRELLVLRGHRDRVWGVAFTADGQRLVSRSGDGTMRTWSLANGACVEERPLADTPTSGWQARAGMLETTITDPAGKAVAWLPAVPTLLQAHPSGRLWGGVLGNHVMLFALEGSHG
jgi:WD40 repeat protein